MPGIDLSSATFGRVANQEVDLLRIADQNVWQKPSVSPPTMFSVFEGAPIPGIAGYSDIGEGDWLMNQFMLRAGPPLKIHSVGMYIPPGDENFIDGTVNGGPLIGLQFSSDGFLRVGGPYPVTPTTKDHASRYFVSGWNWFDFDTPVSWSAVTPYVLAGYKRRPNYLYSSTLSNFEQQSAGANFSLVDQGRPGALPERCWWRPSIGASWTLTDSRSYGIDLRVSIDA